MTSWGVGIDIGGTFTDVVAMDRESGALHVTKVPSTPDEPSQAVSNGLEQLFAENEDITPEAIRFFAHGTTVATNALLELRGAKVGLMINTGFRATYELRGGNRPSGSDLIDTFYQKPMTLVPQRLTAEIGGRLGPDGGEIEALDEEAIRVAAKRFKEQGIDSIAVCYLFSFMNPAHEQRTAQVIREVHPGCRVSLSSTILPVIREYARMSTTVLDAYVGPIVQSYLLRLNGRLEEAGVRTKQLFIMQSNGGLTRIDTAANHPNETLLSGPAAGVVFGANIGSATGERNLVTFDMGGTSTDISLMPENLYQETRQGKIGGQDIGTPMIMIRTIGAGGGTIAWIGPDGRLKCGPRSAGAYPGPACYGLGGTEPTITDANLVLSYLEPSTFIGGKLQVDPELSRKAIQEKVAGPLGLTVEEAALGVVQVVNVNMEVAVRLSFVESGLDQRRFALIAFGGAGPMHAARIAKNVGVPRVIVPPYPGLSCAVGLLQTEVKHHYLHSRLESLGRFPVGELNQMLEVLDERAMSEALSEGFAESDISLHRGLDLRYPYQGYELTVPCPSGKLGDEHVAGIRTAFNDLHQQVYGTSAPDETPEVVNVRVMSLGEVPTLELPRVPAGDKSPEAALVGTRKTRFEEHKDYVDTAVYRRDALLAGNEIEGPAVIQQLDSTTVVLPGQTVVVDEFGNLIINVS
ncbi:MAG TPA: hydantoinase/oxoprolinase family protein [Dehalococcoidia bacterium]